MAHDENDQQGESGKRHRDERHNANHYGSPGQLRPPHQPRNGGALRVGYVDEAGVDDRRRSCARVGAADRTSQMEVLDLQTLGNPRQQPLIEIFDRRYDRHTIICDGCGVVRTDRNGSNDSGLTTKSLNHGDGAARLG